MDSTLCSQCERNRTAITCALCGGSVCKACAEILAPEAFAYVGEDLASELRQGTFCRHCYEEKVSSPLAEYFEVLEVAKNIDCFFKNQGKETRLVRRTEKPVQVSACEDRDEVVMRLAYRAAKAGFDSVVDIELKSEKVRDGSFQKLIWRGSGVPANTKGRVITTDKSIWHNPN